MAPKRNSYNKKKMKSFNEESSRTVVRRVAEPTAMSTPDKATVDRSRWIAPSLILGIGLFLHFVGLGHPRSVIFDEVHFGKFVTQYCCTGERFFDIHPPHAKLILAATSRLAGYTGNFPFNNIGQSYGEVSAAALRWFPALMGTLIPLLVWLVLRQLGASRPAAFLGGMAIGLDNALMLQSRVLGLDSILIASIFGALAIFLHAMKRTTERRWRWLLAAGMVGGLATGTKVTGGAILALMTLVLFRPFLSRPNGNNFRFAMKGWGWLALGSIPVYLSGFVIHFMLLTKPGFGDRFYQPNQSMIDNVIGLQRVMLRANYFLTQTHPGMSKPWQWLIDKRPIFYWAHTDQALFLWGNPILWWGTTALFCFIVACKLMSMVTSLRIIRGDARPQPLQWIPLLGFIISFLPMVFIPRALFLYHYFTPLIFLTMYVILWLDGAEWIKSSRLLRQRKSYYAVLALLVIAFALVSPVTYGFNPSPEYYRSITSFLHNFK
jgi:dolichyl-phosphate-mannose-protein mannosyltransferase